MKNAEILLAEKPFYDKYYDEIDSENDWDFRLLKRKDKITNILEHEIKNKNFIYENDSN